MSSDTVLPAGAPAPPLGVRARLTRRLPLLRPLVATLTVSGIGYAVASEWHGKHGTPGVSDALRTLAWPSVALSLLAAFAGTATSLLAWRALLADEGHRLAPVAAGRIFLVGQLGKYLPGSIWSVVLQMELAKREGVPRGRAFTTSLAWVGLSMTTALTVGLFGLPVLASAHHRELWWLLAALPVLLVASIPPVLTRLVNLVLRVFGKGKLRRALSWRGVLSACGWLTATWICFGLHLWLLANALGAPGVGGLVRCIGGFALAMAAGVLFVIVPSGAGVREVIIVAALAPVMSRPEALGIAVVSRVLFIVTDVVAAGAAALSGIRQVRSVATGKRVMAPAAASPSRARTPR
ncbi:MAG: lysylphosphatidylglycerol synthase domain-containing protein [Jatrophihabitans sp.]